MDEVKKQVELVLDGFFYFFGFTENPADKPSKEIVNKKSSKKMVSDIKRINADYRKEYLKVRNQVFCIEE